MNMLQAFRVRIMQGVVIGEEKEGILHGMKLVRTNEKEYIPHGMKLVRTKPSLVIMIV